MRIRNKKKEEQEEELDDEEEEEELDDEEEEEELDNDDPKEKKKELPKLPKIPTDVGEDVKLIPRIVYLYDDIADLKEILLQNNKILLKLKKSRGG